VAGVARLTKLEHKLAEVTGLAMAAQGATTRVIALTEPHDATLVETLQAMLEDAAETEERCTELADTFDGKAASIMAEARAVEARSAALLAVYLGEGATALEGFEFLTMAVAAEVGNWSILSQFNVRVTNEDLGHLIAWAVPIQHRHLQAVLEGSRELASEEDPETFA
jgi:hypothetical protein